MQINHPGHLNWRLTGFDGYLEQDKDKDSWDLLCYLTQDTLFPWLIIRDFSNLLSSNDMTGFVVHPNWLMQGFHHTLLDCNLIGLPMECYQYTWARWHGQFHAIKEKLDIGKRDWPKIFHGHEIIYFWNKRNDAFVYLWWERASFKPSCTWAKKLRTTHMPIFFFFFVKS